MNKRLYLIIVSESYVPVVKRIFADEDIAKDVFQSEYGVYDELEVWEYNEERGEYEYKFNIY